MKSYDPTIPRKSDGTLWAYSEFGSYPLRYDLNDKQPCCAACANMIDADESSESIITGVYPNWEDPELYCGCCGDRIESAYAEIEEWGDHHGR